VKAPLSCSECGRTITDDDSVRCYDCGRTYCLVCAGSDWIGVCPDCEEAFEGEEDYWDWK